MSRNDGLTSGRSTSSILKSSQTPGQRDEKLRRRQSQSVARVSFNFFSENGTLHEILTDAGNNIGLKAYKKYMFMLADGTGGLQSTDYRKILTECHGCIELLTPKFKNFVEVVLGMDWFRQPDDIIISYQQFLIDLLAAHNKYTQLVIKRLMSHWLPNVRDKNDWVLGTPSKEMEVMLKSIHLTVEKILDLIPMSFDVIVEHMDALFPYFTKPSFIVSGYVHNVLWLVSYRPIFKDVALTILINKLILMDVNAPKSIIEHDELNYENMEQDDIFEMELPLKECVEDEMRNALAETLDICMEKFLNFIQNECSSPKAFNSTSNSATNKFFKHLIDKFELYVLPVHKIHHVQFFMFYICSFKINLLESFLSLLWKQIIDPNQSTVVRKACIGYIASMLSRAKYVPLAIIKRLLFQLCSWARQYIQQSDSICNVNPGIAHNVFYAVCQGVFYIISFRSRDLTNGSKNLHFLQSLQLSALVQSQLNPLKMCEPTIATAFAGVTRSHQLAYCHAILERNARRKLATIYKNGLTVNDDCVDMIFPFDLYLLKKSGKRISPIYLHYQPSDAEEEPVVFRRKRIESVADSFDDGDDFLLDKRLKISKLSMSIEKELIHYGSSPIDPI